MTKAAPGLWWVAPGSFRALFHRSDLRKVVEAYWLAELEWRWATRDLWPSGDLTWEFHDAREGGYGFVVEVGQRRLFLAPRGWVEPEWGLADQDLNSGRWRPLGEIEPASPRWALPAPAHLGVLGDPA